MDTPFFREIKPYSRGGNNIKNAKRIYYFIIEFMCRTTSFKMVSVEHNELTYSVYSERILPFVNLFLYTNPGFFEPFLSIIVRTETCWSTLVMYLSFWKFPWSCDHGGCESWLVFTSQLNSLGMELSLFLCFSLRDQ